MALRKKKHDTEAAESDSETAAPSVLDRLTDLRGDIKDESAVTQLIDILIDANGGDSEQVSADIEEGRKSDASREPEPMDPEFQPSPV